jgi:hypothetical protein
MARLPQFGSGLVGCFVALACLRNKKDLVCARSFFMNYPEKLPKNNKKTLSIPKNIPNLAPTFIL